MLCFTTPSLVPPQPTTVPRLILTTHNNNTTHTHSHTHMAVSASFSSYSLNKFTFFSFIIITLLLLLPHCNTTVAYAEQANDTRETPPPPPLPPPPPPPEKPSSAFKPGMAVVVGVLTTMFSLTFLLLLYIKHCSATTSDSTAATSYQTSRATASASAPFSGRKNSGIDRSIVESLPIFRFGSLRGHKDGLDCAVCLNKFESSEVLRLLPKCKHAFHVECVDTWLDAHSTCPLCRYRVDPEDILLVEDTKLFAPPPPPPQNESCSERNSFVLETRRVSGRHSSVGEREGGFLEIILEDETERRKGASFRRSLDSATCTSSRSKKKESVKGVTGWLVRPRKDGMLLVTQQKQQEAERGSRMSAERRVEHRIIVSPSPKQYCGLNREQRWSDVQPLDLLYLTSEMIISGRNNSSSNNNNNSNNNRGKQGRGNYNDDDDGWVINTRSVSEITGLSRFMRNNRGGRGEERGGGGEREEGVVSRWLAWISRSQTQPAVR